MVPPCDLFKSKYVNSNVNSSLLNKQAAKSISDPDDPDATADHVRNLIEDTKKLLIPDVGSVVGAWGLIDNDPVSGDSRQDDMDAVFILTPDSYYVAQYDNAVDKVRSEIYALSMFDKGRGEETQTDHTDCRK